MTWTHSNIEDAANFLDDQGYGTLGDQIRALLAERDRIDAAAQAVIAMLDEYDLDATADEDPQTLVTLCATAICDLNTALRPMPSLPTE